MGVCIWPLASPTPSNQALEQKLEKESPSLGRTATYTKALQISRLPQYLVVNFMRFWWKATEQKKAKILRVSWWCIDDHMSSDRVYSCCSVSITHSCWT